MTKPIQINLAARRRLTEILGANGLSYCYQCGACVGDCPAARFYPDFNPREIMMTALLGDLESLLSKEALIWKCSNCYNCYERCPQDVRPVEVIIALKNLARQEGHQPPEVDAVYEAIVKTGRSAPVLGSLAKKRAQLGLPPLPEINMAEIDEILRPDEEEEARS